MANYAAHTMVCVDLAIPGSPVTTLGMKPADAHVNALDQGFVLVPFGNVTDHAPWSTLVSPGVSFGASFVNPSLPAGASILRFNWSQDAAPIRYLSPDLNFSARHERKRFRFIEFHGRGSAAVRVFVDGRLVNSGNVDAAETPSHARKYLLPRGTRGYTMRLEITGLVNIRLIEIGYEPMPWTS